VDPIKRLNDLLSDRRLLTKPNSERTARIFFDAAKIILCRQKELGKPSLKMKEIAAALVLVESFHSSAFRFEATGELAANFGQCPLDKALDYYEKCVMGEEIDHYGRKIKLDEDGIKSLYKDKITGKHIVSDENYEEVRGKRLPWIRHVLKNSKGIFEKEETIHGVFRRTFLYTAIVSIPIEPKPQVSYYVVVVHEGGNKELKLVTAYSMFNVNRFLKVIAVARPWGRRKDEAHRT
jgi:hypothetical protein